MDDAVPPAAPEGLFRLKEPGPAGKLGGARQEVPGLPPKIVTELKCYCAVGML